MQQQKLEQRNDFNTRHYLNALVAELVVETIGDKVTVEPREVVLEKVVRQTLKPLIAESPGYKLTEGSEMGVSIPGSKIPQLNMESNAEAVVAAYYRGKLSWLKSFDHDLKAKIEHSHVLISLIYYNITPTVLMLRKNMSINKIEGIRERALFHFRRV